jgi:chromate transport protein ChrA
MTNRGEHIIKWTTEENRQYNDQQRWSLYCLFSSVGHYIVCSPLLVIILSVLLCWSLYFLFSSVGHYIVCSPLLQQRTTDSRMTNRGEQIMTNRGEHTIEWPTEENRQYNDQQRRTDNIMTNRGEQTMLVIILCVLLCWSLYCLFSSVGHYIVCSPLLIIILSVLLYWSLYCLFSSVGHYIVGSPLLQTI